MSAAPNGWGAAADREFGAAHRALRRCDASTCATNVANTTSAMNAAKPLTIMFMDRVFPAYRHLKHFE